MKLQTQPNAQALFSALLHEHLSLRIKTWLDRHLLLKSRLRIVSKGIAMHSENLRIDPESMYRPSPNTHTHTVAEGANDRHIGCGVRPRRGFYSTEIIKIKCPKGKIVSKTNRGSGVLVVLRGTVKEGQCSERKGSEEGGGVRQPHKLPTAPGRRLPPAASSSWPTALCGDKRPGILARQPHSGCGSSPDRGSGSSRLWRRGIPLRSLPVPTRTPACMHGKETGLSRRGALVI